MTQNNRYQESAKTMPWRKGPGPWDNEPDLELFGRQLDGTAIVGLVARRQDYGTLFGMIGVREPHPWATAWLEYKPFNLWREPHCGLDNFLSGMWTKVSININNLYLLPKQYKLPTDTVVFCFQALGPSDFIPRYHTISDEGAGVTYRTFEYMLYETECFMDRAVAAWNTKTTSKLLDNLAANNTRSKNFYFRGTTSDKPSPEVIRMLRKPTQD